ncbi:hypothetical protein SAMN06265348_103287 [Pedobacter westerhofensis]|uniref:Uncharacterized protein n=1 Tax=Pedobacter westerhofensis TaxID=425512 RepID=A0A521C7P1_9SPHI|nr:hypothetical protein [Pedobacter westerhofensis]SMO55436.1 hypothetical protein SAMN06265348_103287 [Pedobacter westerhofensis]
MRYLGLIILIIVCSSACRTEECIRSCSTDFNISVLSLWEKQTNINIKYRRNNKLRSLFESAAKDKISIFDRRIFLQDISNLKELDLYKFDSLIVIEINRSGEVYTSKKYLLASCRQDVVIIKFQLSPKKWELIQTYKLRKDKLDDAVKLLTNRSDTTIFWGDNVTDLVAVSKFRGQNEISVEVFGNLSEKQYKALGIIEK